MKNLPNLITFVRLFAACVLLVLTIFRADHGQQYFLILFIAAGVSDMLDGIAARRLGLCTEFGARLDSVSDQLFYLATAIFLICTSTEALAQAAPLLTIGAIAQLTCISFSSKRFGKFPAYHTTYSRGSAYLIFFSVIAFWLCHWTCTLYLVAAFWLTSNIEGIIITAILKHPASNVESIARALQLAKECEQRPLAA